MVEIKELTGLVQTKTENSLKINNYWVKFFNVDLIKNISAGENVKVKYSEKEKDGKLYRNGKEIKIIETKEEFKELTSESVKPKIISDTTINTLIMTIKELYLNINNKLTLEEVTNIVMESYKLIIKNL